jgi:hypothetical protein
MKIDDNCLMIIYGNNAMDSLWQYNMMIIDI